MAAFAPTLQTRRLRLRPFVSADVDAVTYLINDKDVSDTLESIPYPYRREYAEAWIAAHPDLFEEGREIHLAIELRSARELAGAIALLPRGPDEPPHLGFWLGRMHWGLGYATEAVEELLRYARDQLSLPSVAARCMVENPASLRVLAKAGLSRVGPCEPVLKNGRQRPVDLFLIEFGLSGASA